MNANEKTHHPSHDKSKPQYAITFSLYLHNSDFVFCFISFFPLLINNIIISISFFLRY